MTPLPLIGLAGYSRVGKTSVARAISDGRGRFIRSFAEPIKIQLAIAWGISLDQLEAIKHKPWVRDALVAIGAGGRKVDPDMWVNRLFAAYDANPHPLIIDDVRYVNEVEAIRKRGGVVVCLCRMDVGPANDEERNSISAVLNMSPIVPYSENIDIRTTADAVVELAGKEMK